MELWRLRGALRGVELQLHVDFARLDYAAIRGIVERQERESDGVDFKQQINFTAPKAIAADVASMANHLGGIIIFGIAGTTEDGAASADQPSAQRLLPMQALHGREHVADWVEQRVAEHIVPRIDIGTQWIPDPGTRLPAISLSVLPAPRRRRTPSTSVTATTVSNVAAGPATVR